MTRYSIASYWYSRGQFVMDLHEPSCFACGVWKERWDKEPSANARWERCGLEKAHIIAKSIDGEDVPHNYLLLCPHCHENAPMSDIPDVMIAWAKRQPSWIVTFQKELEEELQAIGLTKNDVAALTRHDISRALRANSIHSHPFRKCASPASVGLALHKALQRSSAIVL